MGETMHNIKFVVNQTGLSAHVIRAWERRYEALTPDRTQTNRRLYSDEDIEKLLLLKKAVEAGQSIGRIARLSTPELNGMLARLSPEQREQRLETSSATAPADSPLPYSQQLRLAVQSLDAERLEMILRQATIALGAIEVIERLLPPLLEWVGTGWREGEVRVAQEHLATAVVRTYLGRTLDSIKPSAHSPCLVITTPAGQVHELGALMVAVTAASEGWRVLYLGPNLPAEEISSAVRQMGAKGVALSIVYPPDDLRLHSELENLRSGVGEEVAILVGGRGAKGYSETLYRIGATLATDLTATRFELESLRSRANRRLSGVQPK